MSTKPVILITGASRGIGRAISVKFAEEGYQAVLTARNTKHLQETAEIIRKNGETDPLVIPANLRDSHQTSRLVGSTIQRFGKIDILVNNAGILHLKPFLDITTEEYDEMFDVNIKAAFQLTQHVVPGMIQRKSGTIINVASLAGKNGFKTGTGYAATKFALRGFAASLMLELREHNIRVITVFPGSVDTRAIVKNAYAPSPETMLKAEDVAHIIYAASTIPPRAMVSEIDIRPSNPQK